MPMLNKGLTAKNGAEQSRNPANGSNNIQSGLKGAIRYTEIKTTIESTIDPRASSIRSRDSTVTVNEDRTSKSIASLKSASAIIEKRYHLESQDQPAFSDLSGAPYRHQRQGSASSSSHSFPRPASIASAEYVPERKMSGLSHVMGKLNGNKKAAGAMGSLGGTVTDDLADIGSTARFKNYTPTMSKLSLNSPSEYKQFPRGPSSISGIGKTGRVSTAGSTASEASGAASVLDINKMADHLATLTPAERKIFLDGYLASKGISRTELQKSNKPTSGLTSPVSQKSSPSMSPNLGFHGFGYKSTPAQRSVLCFDEEDEHVPLPTTSDVGLTTRNAALQRQERLDMSPKHFASEW